MRKVTLIGTIIAAILVFGLMLVPIAGANNTAAPPLQATSAPTTAATEAATEAPTTAATEAATTAPAATAAATAAATTTAATATTAPGALPRTGGDSGIGGILLGIAALFIIGVAVAMLVSSRRRVQP
jgi:LPXTG-motif cell wall-anchored protein